MLCIRQGASSILSDEFYSVKLTSLTTFLRSKTDIEVVYLYETGCSLER